MGGESGIPLLCKIGDVAQLVEQLGRRKPNRCVGVSNTPVPTMNERYSLSLITFFKDVIFKVFPGLKGLICGIKERDHATSALNG